MSPTHCPEPDDGPYTSSFPEPMRHNDTERTNTRPASPDIPCYDYVGYALHGDKRTYLIVSRCWEDGDLRVYSVRDRDGELFEAQAFANCHLPTKLYLSRKRRIQRLKQSGNHVEEVELDEAKVLVSLVPGEGFDRHRNSQRKRDDVMARREPLEEQFPPLGSSPGARTAAGGQDCWDGCGRSTYAEAASAPRDYLSKCQEDSKQQENDNNPREINGSKNRCSWIGSRYTSSRCSTLNVGQSIVV